MIKKLSIGIAAGAVMLSVFAVYSAFAAPSCTQTGFFRDGIKMTAAVIDPTATVTGDVNASGCNIGVYFGPGHNGSVNLATIHGANYYGVVVQKATVTVSDSNIHQIGENPFNGDQHGVGIYYATIAGVTNGDCTSGTTKGTVQNTSVSAYQKGGIVANCAGTSVIIKNNVVEGQGPVNYIAQNGIQVGYGAYATVTGNIVSGNSYTGANQAASGGILVVGGPCYGGNYTSNTLISHNTVILNDVGVYLSNLDAHCAATNSKTNIQVNYDTIALASLNNTTGNGPTQGYQVGVSDQGNYDKITYNTISGSGYDPENSSPSHFINWIDVSATNHANVQANKFH